MVKIIRFIVILAVYEFILALLGYLFFSQAEVLALLGAFNLAMFFFIVNSQKFLVGCLGGNRITKSGHIKLFQRYQNIIHKYQAKDMNLFEYKSDEINSVYLSSLVGKPVLMLSSSLIHKASVEDLEVHFPYMAIKQTHRIDSFAESLVAVWGLFNLYIINFIMYPFIKFGQLFNFKQIEYVRKSFIFLFVPVFGLCKKFVLGKNNNELIYKKLENMGVPKAHLVSAIMKSNDTILNDLFELEILEYNKFLSTEFSMQESQLI